MVEYPRALRIAHRVVDCHPVDARAYVAGKIADAEQTAKHGQAAQWRKVLHFVDRLLADPVVAPPAHRRHPARPHRARAPRH